MDNKLGSALGRKKAEIKTKEIHTFFMWNIWSERHLQVSGFLERNRQSLSFGLMIKWFLIGWDLGRGVSNQFFTLTLLNIVIHLSFSCVILGYFGDYL